MEKDYTQLFDEENPYLHEEEFIESEKSDCRTEDMAYAGIMRRELLHHIDRMLSRLLEEDEKSVVERYFGLGCEAQHPERIARDMGYRPSAIEPLVQRAVVKLRMSDDSILLYQYLHGKRI